MNTKLKKIEMLEYDYFKKIDFDLSQDLQKMIDGLNSKDKIKNDWKKFFDRIDKKKQNSDFCRGAERIYYWLFSQFGKPSSAPIGADMFFETHNAFVHIDIKTTKFDNPSDYKGKVPLGANQTSYYGKHYEVHLPTFYNKGKPTEKICLTYVINIVYEYNKNGDIVILAILLIAVPNGELKIIYDDKIIGASKNKGEAFRYEYKNSPKFKLLNDKPYRIKFLFLDRRITQEKIIGFRME
ncbi:MAG: hypothetical protein AB1349_04715 [Elusimicrobiota bacterium]